MPEVTPPAVMMSPSRTTRAGSGMAPNRPSMSRQAQWQAARLPFSSPVAARISEPVHTEVRYRAPEASRFASPMNAGSLATSVAAKPPGKNSRSQLSIAAIGVVPAKVRPPSDSTAPPAREATMVSDLGMRLNTVCGAVKSSWVIPG